MSAGGEAPTVSVLIPAYNEEGNIGTLLEYLRGASPRVPGLHEVLVDVSGSTDRTAQIVSDFAATWQVVTMVDTGQRDGLLRALDRMMRLSSGDIVVRMDADIRPTEGAVERVLGALGEPFVGIAGPRVVPSEGRSRLVNRLATAEWELHHEVSLRAPKTTLLQVVLRETAFLPPDSGVEDAALQEEAEKAGLRAAYVPDAVILTMPPSSLPALLVQRIRTIQQLKLHRMRGHRPPSTASPTLVGEALLTVIRRARIPLIDLLGFLSVEAAARAWAVVGGFVPGTAGFTWAPVEGTKNFDWAAHVDRPVRRADRY